MLPEGWEHVQRVLVVRLDNIGDVIMLGPALRALRTALPQTHITLMATPAGSQVAPMLPWVDDVIVESVIWQDISGRMRLQPERELAMAAMLAARSFDAAIIFTSFSQSPYPPAFICYLAGIPIRLGQSKEFGGGVLTHWVKPLPDEIHQAERNLFLMESAGFRVAGRCLELRLPEQAEMAAAGLLQAGGLDLAQPFVLLAPGASAEARRYAADRYAQVAVALAGVREPGTGRRLQVVVAGSQREQVLAEPILAAGAGKPVFSLMGRTSVTELASIISRARLVIANDSGPMHLADAFRRPMVILYAGTEHESQWRPRSAPARLLRRTTSCSPCYAFRCPYNMECLDIPAGEVVEEALAMLEQTRDLEAQRFVEGLIDTRERLLSV